VNGREVARSGEWAQHFSNASCWYIVNFTKTLWDNVLMLFCLSVFLSDSRISQRLIGQVDFQEILEWIACGPGES